MSIEEIKILNEAREAYENAEKNFNVFVSTYFYSDYTRAKNKANQEYWRVYDVVFQETQTHLHQLYQIHIHAYKQTLDYKQEQEQSIQVQKYQKIQAHQEAHKQANEIYNQTYDKDLQTQYQEHQETRHKLSNKRISTSETYFKLRDVYHKTPEYQQKLKEKSKSKCVIQ